MSTTCLSCSTLRHITHYILIASDIHTNNWCSRLCRHIYWTHLTDTAILIEKQNIEILSTLMCFSFLNIILPTSCRTLFSQANRNWITLFEQESVWLVVLEKWYEMHACRCAVVVVLSCGVFRTQRARQRSGRGLRWFPCTSPSPPTVHLPVGPPPFATWRQFSRPQWHGSQRPSGGR